MAAMHHPKLCLLRLRGSAGTAGLGEATNISGLAYGPESAEAIKSVIDICFEQPKPLLAPKPRLLISKELTAPVTGIEQVSEFGA